MKRFLTVTCVASLSVLALSLGTYGKVFESTYKVSATSNLGKAKCQLCHQGKMGGKLNAYGTDIDKALAGKKVLTAAALKSVEAKDSDGDGVANLAEIKADKFPGVK